MLIKKEKIVGILGGYGPYATSEFYRLIIEKTPALKDWDHLHVIIDSNPRIPSRARAFLFNEESPVEYMLQSIERLKKAGADFFVCPCNTAHYFLRPLKNQFTLEFVDMIEVVAENIENSGVKKVGVLGTEVTAQGKIYDELLEMKGIETIHIDDLSKVREVIEYGKLNIEIKKGRALLKELIAELKNKGAEGIIYACTELPIILPSNLIKDIAIFDTSQILAEKVIDLTQ